MIWGHFVLYVLYAVGNGAYRAGERAAKIVKGAYGRARQAASRARTVDALATVARSSAVKVGIDPSGPAGGEAVAHRPGAGKGITDQSRWASGEALAAYLGQNRQLAQQAAEAQLRAARLHAVCPLAGPLGGCADGSDCDVRGRCAAAEIMAAYDEIMTVRLLADETDPETRGTLNVDVPGYPQPFQMIQSPVRPSAEIVCCRACNHPRHDSGRGRCAFTVQDGASEPGGPPAVCGCRAGTDMLERTVVHLTVDGLCDWCGHADHRTRTTPCGYRWAGNPGLSGPCPCLAGRVEPTPEPEPLVEPDGERTRVITEHDPDYNDLQTYLEGGTLESTEAARRLDQRAVDNGQLSPKAFWDTWDELPRRTEQAHKLWCARWRQHCVSDCPVWGAE